MYRFAPSPETPIRVRPTDSPGTADGPRSAAPGRTGFGASVVLVTTLALVAAACSTTMAHTEEGGRDGLDLGLGGTTVVLHVDCDHCDVVYRFSASYAQERVEGAWEVRQTAVWRSEDTAELIVTPLGPADVVRVARITVGREVVAEHLDPQGEAAGRRVHLTGET